ncbi:MAG: ABC transporter permease [Lentimicrobium sp.]|nr:ABC transporter permease [Lentimicrobium sp.]
MIKGLLRDKSRSRLPVIVVTLGVMLTVFMHAYITGFMGDTFEMNAKFATGHVKVMTYAYAENLSQLPNDLALVETDNLLAELRNSYPDFEWAPRIQFGGLIDVPDSIGETRSQGPAIGLGIQLMDKGSKEAERLNLKSSLVAGSLPSRPGEILLSDDFARKLYVKPGDEVTLIGSTMNGSMTMYNFTVVGTVRFGVEIMDRGTIIADLEDVRAALDMPDAAGEILGFEKKGFYNNENAEMISAGFNSANTKPEDEFSPIMKSLARQGNLGQYVKLSEVWSMYISLVFVFAMSLVLWNAGLLGGLRRYGEVGIRLAIGEEKGHIFRSMIVESFFIGLVGSALGTAIGLMFAWLLQSSGMDISGMMQGASMMMPTIIRARITPPDFYIGFIPGVLSTVAGTMLSGIGIYKRQTAKLFKELEA